MQTTGQTPNCGASIGGDGKGITTLKAARLHRKQSGIRLKNRMLLSPKRPVFDFLKQAGRDNF